MRNVDEPLYTFSSSCKTYHKNYVSDRIGIVRAIEPCSNRRKRPSHPRSKPYSTRRCPSSYACGPTNTPPSRFNSKESQKRASYLFVVSAARVGNGAGFRDDKRFRLFETRIARRRGDGMLQRCEIDFRRLRALSSGAVIVASALYCSLVARLREKFMRCFVYPVYRQVYQA